MKTINNRGPIPEGLVEVVQSNLRLPDGMDTDIINTHVAAAIEYVETHTGKCIRTKGVTMTRFGAYSVVLFNDTAGVINSVKINDTDVQYVNLDGMGIRFYSPTKGDDVITINYTSKLSYDDRHINAVVMIASSLYNYPEGLGEMDWKRINSHLAAIT